MASRYYYHIIVLRILLISITALLLSFSINDWRFLLITSVLFTGQIVYLIYFLNHTNRKIAYFFDAVKNEDSTLYFPLITKNKSVKELNSSLNNVNEMIKDIRTEILDQERYYKLMLEHAGTGIMTIDPKGHIRFSNKAARELLQVEVLTHINQFQRIDDELWQLLKSIEPGKKRHVKFQTERDAYFISLISSSIRTQGKTLMLVILQDIKSEMDDSETESWIKLIRILSHEIMNSITPITTLSETIVDYFTADETDNQTTKDEKINEAISGLNVIKDQSRSLLKFVESYRTLTKLPKPSIKRFKADQLIDKVLLLCQYEPSATNIEFIRHIEPKDLSISGDEEQLTQVLINIIKNSIEALVNNSQGIIKISITNSIKGTIIQVEDNGPGIPDNIIGDVFTPFFTSKESGTGIGLSLSKQIIRNHKGKISVLSNPGKATIFIIELM
jgi:two-component system nitrogen regulation sensor histidine kinase NtrY